ncbi:MAG: ROK family protein [Hyphomicrobiales bacterium]|nr:ROK family protein [Hyphomicrobiales bacterium]MBV8825978.1 ROK family protein [Hyphomicrobiales bacterium]MBV9428535.1 ROK family protein [Bradyrhizobiaceae bacterium]
MSEPVFAIDLGATWLRYAAVCPTTLELKTKSVVPTPDAAPDAVQALDSAWREVGRPRRVALAAAPELHGNGIVRRWPNRPAYQGQNLLSTEMKNAAEVAVFDDATAAAISAHRFEPKHQDETTLCITIGTGIGGGAVIAGIPLTGRSGAAMDVGHMPVPSATGLPCTCGRTGCLQAAASGAALGVHLGSSRGPGDVTVDSQRDTAALARAVASIAEALAILDCLFDLDRIVIGGGLGISPLFELIQGGLEQRQIPVAIERHRFGEEAGLVGAALGLVMRNGTKPGQRP